MNTNKSRRSRKGAGPGSTPVQDHPSKSSQGYTQTNLNIRIEFSVLSESEERSEQMFFSVGRQFNEVGE